VKEQIAKRYTDALVDGMSVDDLVALEEIFSSLAEVLEDEKVKSIFFSPYMNDEARQEMLLKAVASAKSDQVNNMIKLLVEKRRTDLFGAIANSLAMMVSKQSKSYAGKVYANTAVKKATLTKFGKSIGAKVDADVAFESVKDDYNGVKVAVDGLGIEVSFSKSNVRDQMIQHILKSI
jgi:F-type H+-transporting ATPase subunit delta